MSARPTCSYPGCEAQAVSGGTLGKLLGRPTPTLCERHAERERLAERVGQLSHALSALPQRTRGTQAAAILLHLLRTDVARLALLDSSEDGDRVWGALLLWSDAESPEERAA
jgi:hypothetical protein